MITGLPMVGFDLAKIILGDTENHPRTYRQLND